MKDTPPPPKGPGKLSVLWQVKGGLIPPQPKPWRGWDPRPPSSIPKDFPYKFHKNASAPSRVLLEVALKIHQATLRNSTTLYQIFYN